MTVLGQSIKQKNISREEPIFPDCSVLCSQDRGSKCPEDKLLYPYSQSKVRPAADTTWVQVRNAGPEPTV